MSSLVPTDEPRVTSQDRLLAMIQKQYPSYHPVLSMVKIAHEEEMHGDEGDRLLAFQCHKEVAKYVVAVDRVSEIKAEITKTRRVVVEMFGANPPTQALENDPSPVLGVQDVTDVAEIRAVVETRGPVEEPEEVAPLRATASVEVMGDPVAAQLDDTRPEPASRNPFF